VNKIIKNWKEAVEKDSSEPERSHTIATSSKLTLFLLKAAGTFTLASTGDDQIAIRIARNLFDGCSVRTVRDTKAMMRSAKEKNNNSTQAFRLSSSPWSETRATKTMCSPKEQ
jgi:hypothetical protein